MTTHILHKLGEQLHTFSIIKCMGMEDSLVRCVLVVQVSSSIKYGLFESIGRFLDYTFLPVS